MDTALPDDDPRVYAQIHLIAKCKTMKVICGGTVNAKNMDRVSKRAPEFMHGRRGRRPHGGATEPSVRHAVC